MVLHVTGPSQKSPLPSLYDILVSIHGSALSFNVNLISFKKCKGLLILQDGPVQPGEHWHSNPWLDSTQLPPFKHGSDRQALSAMEIQRKRCYNVPTHNQSKTETEQHFLKECTKYTDILAQNKTHGPHICQTMRKSPSIPAALYASACFVSF